MQNLRVERVPRDADTIVAENAALSARARRGPDVEQGEVAGAATEVGDQDELFVIVA